MEVNRASMKESGSALEEAGSDSSRLPMPMVTAKASSESRAGVRMKALMWLNGDTFACRAGAQGSATSIRCGVCRSQESWCLAARMRSAQEASSGRRMSRK